ncbi:MAG: hypothetical protein HQL73_14200 [Magnetococcales bacterium]|nr:hypothetical protein [Magnetococcales bacterium]
MKDNFLHNLLPYFSSVSGKKHRPAIMLAVVCALVAFGGWRWHQAQPITAEQITDLNTLIVRVAKARNEQPRRVRVLLWRHFKVGRSADLTQGQLAPAQSWLHDRLR